MSKPTDDQKEIFADMVKAALERGIDVPKIIAEILRKHRPRNPNVGAGDPAPPRQEPR